MKIRNHKLEVLIFVTIAIASGRTQVASHESTLAPTMTTAANATPAAATAASPNLSPVTAVTDKPVVRVNGAELTDRDLLREMMTIFPYARQHNGFPKAEEPKIRMGALKMIEFEELVYQEAERRKMEVAPAKLQKAYSEFRDQFPSQEIFDGYLKEEMHGSKQLLRKQIRRSLLIEQLLKLEVTDKSKVTLAEARAYYEKDPLPFRYPETFAIQTISIMPSDKASEDVKTEAHKKAEETCQKAKATKTYQEFGLLAEQVSEDDFHVNMGDHHAVDRTKLPPQILKVADAMKPGDVSGLVQLGNFYTCFRLDAHTPAGKFTFAQVKDKLIQNLQRDKSEKLRSGLDKKLRQNAKVEEL